MPTTTKSTESAEQVVPLIEARQLGRHYRLGDVDAIGRVSFEIAPAEHIAIVGKSGSGKTTLLNLIGALDRPTTGQIWYRGQLLNESVDLDRHRSRHIGFVFQNYHLLPHLNASENIQIPMFESDLGASERQSRAEELLVSVGLSGRGRHLPSQLSGGECQRVAIARALANRPELILADEPTGALDTESGAAILSLLESFNRQHAITLVVVTHDESVAARAGRQLRLSDGRLESGRS
ncbi:ABC transporter ATP-binding protein [Stieleria sp. TO1_6]|uniref:ABC transporter ATP-binding protein n=1 Tax=Stieleria tagensis TaxID=2956795 RepID=UPI00209ACB87|nr:ABC transporter ATP-binding protein [Stieleria tagensis]MCO8124269.1 ABC transporter ATP-binding protein [Stieleria tagensis]